MVWVRGGRSRGRTEADLGTAGQRGSLVAGVRVSRRGSWPRKKAMSKRKKKGWPGVKKKNNERAGMTRERRPPSWGGGGSRPQGGDGEEAGQCLFRKRIKSGPRAMNDRGKKIPFTEEEGESEKKVQRGSFWQLENRSGERGERKIAKRLQCMHRNIAHKEQLGRVRA